MRLPDILARYRGLIEYDWGIMCLALIRGGLAHLSGGTRLSERVTLPRIIPDPGKYDLSCRDITIQNTTAGATMHPFGQFFSFDRAAVRTFLRTKLRVDFDLLAALSLGLIPEELVKAPPRRIADLRCQPAGGKPFDIQLLYRDYAEALRQRSRYLVEVIVAGAGYFGIECDHTTLCFAAPSGSSLAPRDMTLSAPELSARAFFWSEVGYQLARRERGQTGYTDVNTDSETWMSAGAHRFDSQERVPMIALPFDFAGNWSGGKWAVEMKAYRAYSFHPEPTARDTPSAGAGKSEGAKLVAPTESREARSGRFGFASTKERGKREINLPQRPPLHRRREVIPLRVGSKLGETFGLISETTSSPRLVVTINSFLKGRIVKVTGLIQRRAQFDVLPLTWQQTALPRQNLTVYIRLSRQGIILRRGQGRGVCNIARSNYITPPRLKNQSITLGRLS